MSITNWFIVISIVLFLGLNGLVFIGVIPEVFVTQNFFYSLSNFLSGNVYVVVTALFMHGSIIHLLTNCMMLYVVGNSLEEIGGSRKLALVFLFGGVASFLLSSPAYGVNDLLVGNSGAVFTVMAVLALVNPLSYTRSRPYRFIFGRGDKLKAEFSEKVFDKKNFLLSAFVFIIVQFTIISFYPVLVSLDAQGVEDNVSHLGHLVGFGVGLVFGVVWSDKLQLIVKNAGKYFLLSMFLLVLLLYGFYAFSHVLNPGSDTFIDDFLAGLNIQFFISDNVKCDNYCLENNFDYGLFEEGVCSCKFNSTVVDNLS